MKIDLLYQANLQFQKGLFAEAEELYRISLQKNSKNHRAALGIALAALQQNKMADAIWFMRLAAEIEPNITLYQRNLGELFRRDKQYNAAIACHQTVISMETHSAENHYLLGLAYNDNCQYELAIQHYHIALSYDQCYGLAWNNLGASLEMMSDKQTAKIAYATAIALNPNHVEAQNNLGAICSEEGLLDKARTHFSAAIAANPTFVDAHYNLSQIKTYALDDPHLDLLKSIRKNINHYSLHNQIRYYFALGKALDNTKQYQQAFEAYSEGNRLHYQHRPWDKTNLQQFTDHIPIIFNQSSLTRSHSTNDIRCPIFIVGMPRSGTTLIEQILSSHESIFGAGELTILDNIIHEACRAKNMALHALAMHLTDQECAALGEKYLHEVWRLAPRKQFIIDKMPGNCFYIGMIYRMLPNAKIIHAIRDPMDSCFSCFTHLFKDDMSFSYDQVSLGIYYAFYAKTMQHWQNVLPENTIFNLSYEKLIKDHETLSKQLIDYIGLPWDDNCLNFYKNNRVVKTASLTQVRQPIYKTSLQRWRHFASELEPLLQIVAPYRNIEGISA